MTTKRLMLITSGALLLVIIAMSARALRETPNDDQDSMCPISVTGCDDTPVTDREETTPTTGGLQRLDAAALDALEQRARGLLGGDEANLPANVRIGRRGNETMMLTEDFVQGRMTVELDDTDGSGFRVVNVTVEIPGGTLSYELQPG